MRLLNEIRTRDAKALAFPLSGVERCSTSQMLLAVKELGARIRLLREQQDPLLALRGSGKTLWANEHADDYVRRLRRGWK